MSNASGWAAVAELSDRLPWYKQEGTPTTGTGGFVVFVLVSLAIWLFNTYVNIRQHRRYSDTEVDPRLISLVDKLPPIQGKADEKQGESGAEASADETQGSASGETASTSDDAGTDTEPQYATYKEKILAKFPASQAYAKDKSSFGFVKSTFGLVQGLVFLCAGFSPYMWDLAGKILVQASAPDSAPWWSPLVAYPAAWVSEATAQALVFVCITTAVEMVFSLPFSIFSTFVVEERHGFNKTSAVTFVKDLVIGLVLQAVFGLPILAVILTIIEGTGEYFFVYVSLALMAITFFMMTIYPTVIAPCYNKFEPLPDSSLKTAIEELARGQEFPLTKLFTIDGSRRSAHSNAYLYGFCNNKRIVLFDTLLKQCEEEEIVAILGHEIGHWKMGHTVKNMVMSQVQIFLTFYALSFFLGSTTIFHVFGFRASASSPAATFIGLSLFLECAFTPLNPLLQFFMSYMTRLYEFQADAYAARLGHARPLQVGLVKLQLENLGALAVDPLYSAYHYSHPPVVERLRALTRLETEMEKKSS
eukprot:INCI12702.1.p1 GENE.INCI12702.1~~INCI12702.1.p1  ORF type:complete len:532 (-),score=81.38 INCI12702.1:579-2174(-)